MPGQVNKILTLIVPTYNMEKYLDRCLSSLIIQDRALLSKVEVLIINDGSTDSSSAIAKHYQQRYPETFVVVDKPNGNYGSCINLGINLAKGKYFKVLDADDYFDTVQFGEFIQFLLNSESDCIISKKQDVLPDGTIAGTTEYDLPIGTTFGLNDLGVAAWNMWMHCVCYRTANVRAIGYHQTEGISYTDQELICMPMSAVRSLEYFPKVIYKYLVGREGQTVDTGVWERNFFHEIEGAKVMMRQEQNLYQNCTEEGHNYIRQRISRRVYTIYNAYFTKFKGYGNNDLMVNFDKYLREYDMDLFNEQNNDRILGIFHYVSHWRKDYKPDTLYLNIVRFLAKKIHKLRYG